MSAEHRWRGCEGTPLHKLNLHHLLILLLLLLPPPPPLPSPPSPSSSSPSSYRCLEEIITEQVNKLNVTLKDIETLNTFARSKECQLTELVKENPQQTPAASTVQVEGVQTEPTVSSTGMEAKREKLTRELQEIERERYLIIDGGLYGATVILHAVCVSIIWEYICPHAAQSETNCQLANTRTFLVTT